MLMNKFYIIAFSLLIIGQIFLISSRYITIFSEIYFYPWLISKNVVLYKDIFINHGFFLYLLLSILPFDRYMIAFRIFYTVIQVVNLLLVLLIVKKYSSKLAIVFAGIFYITMSFIVTENALWDESVITTLCLSLIYIIKSDKKIHWISGVLVGFMIFIKPTSFLFIVPILYFTKNWRVIFSSLIIIVLGIVYLLYQHALSAFIDNVLIYNIFYGKYFSTFNDKSVGNFFNLFYLLIAILFASSILEKKFKKTKIEFCFLLLTYVFLVPRMQFVHSLPFVTIFIVYAASVIFSTKKYIKIFLLLIFIIFFLGFLYRKAKHEYIYLLTSNKMYLEKESSANLQSDVRKLNTTIQNLYVFGLQEDIYILLNKPPVVHFVSVYPWVSEYYKNIENETIQEIISTKVNVIIIPKPIYLSYKNMRIVDSYIRTHFKLRKDNLDYEIYTLK